MRSLEKQIVDKVANLIQTKSENKMEVLSKRLGLWKFKELINKLPEPAFLQPDIDILYRTKDINSDSLKIIGAEVKTIYMRKQMLNLKFYEGLNEAISLLRFGLDSVLFFQVFLASIQDDVEEMARRWIDYQVPVRDIIRALKLPISYTPALDFINGDRLMSDPIQVIDLKNPFEFPDDKHVIIRNRGANPFLHPKYVYPTVIRNFLFSKFIR